MYRKAGELLSGFIVFITLLTAVFSIQASQKAADDNAHITSAVITALGEKGVTVEYLGDYGQVEAKINVEDAAEYKVGDKVSVRIRSFNFLWVAETTFTLAESAETSGNGTEEINGREQK